MDKKERGIKRIPDMHIFGIDEIEGEISVGRSEYDSPEIDNIVHIQSPEKIGSFNSVKISQANENELIGNLINNNLTICNISIYLLKYIC